MRLGKQQPTLFTIPQAPCKPPGISRRSASTLPPNLVGEVEATIAELPDVPEVRAEVAPVTRGALRHRVTVSRMLGAPNCVAASTGGIMSMGCFTAAEAALCASEAPSTTPLAMRLVIPAKRLCLYAFRSKRFWYFSTSSPTSEGFDE